MSVRLSTMTCCHMIHRTKCRVNHVHHTRSGLEPTLPSGMTRALQPQTMSQLSGSTHFRCHAGTCTSLLRFNFEGPRTRLITSFACPLSRPRKEARIFKKMWHYLRRNVMCCGRGGRAEGRQGCVTVGAGNVRASPRCDGAGTMRCSARRE